MIRYYLKHGLTSWFLPFLIIFCLNSDFLFRNFLSIPSDTKIKWSFGTNSREANKFLNLDYLAGLNAWIINVKYVADVSTSRSSDMHWIIKFSVRHKNNKKKQALLEIEIVWEPQSNSEEKDNSGILKGDFTSGEHQSIFASTGSVLLG